MILETPFGTFKGRHKDISDVIKLHDNLIILSFLAQFTNDKDYIKCKKMYEEALTRIEVISCNEEIS